MKKHHALAILAVTLLASTATLARTPTIDCRSNGATAGIVHLVARPTDLTGQVNVSITVRDSKGIERDLPQFNSNGDLGSEFQVLPEIDRGPHGRLRTFLAKKSTAQGPRYVLVTRTICNDYYMEETCMGDQVVGETEDESIACGQASGPKAPAPAKEPSFCEREPYHC